MGQQPVADIIVWSFETSEEKWIFAGFPDVVFCPTYVILGVFCDEVDWVLFNCNQLMSNLFFDKPGFEHFYAKVLAPNPRWIQTATIFLMTAERLEQTVGLNGFAVFVVKATFDTPCHGRIH